MSGESAEERIRRLLPDLSTQTAEDLARVVERLVGALRAERIYVFGSHARSKAAPESDIDLLVVVPHVDEPSYRLAQTAYRVAAPHSLALDILVMPQDAFERKSRALASLPATVLREGCLLYAA